jgi:hypothetical protein
MLHQDYFIRVLREFFDALARAMQKERLEDKSQAVHKLYEQYLGEYEFWQNASIEDTMERLALYPEEERLSKMEMLAELYYVEADFRAKPFSDILLERALTLFEYLDLHSGTFSISRRMKVDAIRFRLRKS